MFGNDAHEAEVVMHEMNRKKLYIWRLGTFLHTHQKTMSAKDLADHLNRNELRTASGTEFEGLVHLIRRGMPGTAV
jgi:hypothetical protein